MSPRSPTSSSAACIQTAFVGAGILACHDRTLLGWVALARTPSRLVGHWATVHHLQTHPSHRGRGVGSALMRRLHHLAREELGLEQLHLAVRGGMGLEGFYARLGWREIGRWPDRKCRAGQRPRAPANSVDPLGEGGQHGVAMTFNRVLQRRLAGIDLAGVRSCVDAVAAAARRAGARL
jgi:hypothetical protein